MSEKVKNQKYERKFIVLLPDIWELSNHYIISAVDITQTFLRNYNKDGDCHVRVEKRNDEVRYYYSRKICERQRGLRIVVEDYEITKEEYEALIKTRINPKCAVIKKTRYVFKYKEQIFNLDILKDEIINEELDDEHKVVLSKKQGILMIEMPFPDEQLEVPRRIFFDKDKDGTVREITNDMSYTTKALSKLLKKRNDAKKEDEDN